MSRMSELHHTLSQACEDLTHIQQIMLGQRKVAQDHLVEARKHTPLEVPLYMARIECINDLLLEFEAAGVEFPTNVVTLDTVTTPCAANCACPRCAGLDYTGCWPKEL